MMEMHCNAVVRENKEANHLTCDALVLLEVVSVWNGFFISLSGLNLRLSSKMYSVVLSFNRIELYSTAVRIDFLSNFL
jgi:hypothetical protein